MITGSPLNVVSDYVSLARVLLQDQVPTYRYPDADLVMGLNMAFSEALRLRADLFLSLTTMPVFTANDNTPVPVDAMYAVAFVYYMCGFAQLRDDEEVQDQRAAAFLSLFNQKLGTVA